MTNRQFHSLMGLMLLNSAVLFNIAGLEPLMWGFGVMSIMMFLPVVAYGCARITLAASAWLHQHKPRRREHHWYDGDSDGEAG